MAGYFSAFITTNHNNSSQSEAWGSHLIDVLVIVMNHGDYEPPSVELGVPIWPTVFDKQGVHSHVVPRQLAVSIAMLYYLEAKTHHIL